MQQLLITILDSNANDEIDPISSAVSNLQYDGFIVLHAETKEVNA